MRESQMSKVPYTIVIGDKEVSNNSVNYRLYSTNETKEIKLDEFINMVLKDIKDKK